MKKNTANPQGQFIDWFRQSTPYINAFRDKIFVISFGGELLSDTQFTPLVHDILLLHSLGVKLVLVHGARPQIEARLKKLGGEINIVNGLRITNDLALECVVDAASSVRVEIEALLSMGLANTLTAGKTIHINSGNFVTAKPLGIRDGVDYQHTGEVRKISSKMIISMLELKNIVLIPPLGYSPTGEVFNLNSKDLAANLASELNADKLIYLTNDKGITDTRNKLLRELTSSDAEILLDSFNNDTKNKKTKKLTMSENTIRCIQNAIKAVNHNVPRCHLIDRHIDGGLLTELFTRDGCGSLISANRFESLRQATIDDIASLIEIIRPLEDEGILAKRSRENIEKDISAFTVIERDGMVIACAALHPFIKEKTAELSCFVVHPDYQSSGRGEVLFKSVQHHAKQLGLESIFVLTTHTSHWFKERGFKTKEIKTLPIKRRLLYNNQRNSKVLVKNDIC